MYRNKKIALVIPAYREEKLIKPTLDHVPELIDKIIVVDDASPDNQAEVVASVAAHDPRIELIKHKDNCGPGQAIITGYLRASQEGYGLVVVVGGDFQMDLMEVRSFLDPLIDGEADYVKGNRFLYLKKTLSSMPKIRILGNMMITFLTKFASGYYKVSDVVDGYTAITKEAIDTIDWTKAWKKYGYPMDFLIRLNAYGLRIMEVARTPVYIKGARQSQIKGLSYTVKVFPMLLRGYFWRLGFKYFSFSKR